MPVSKKPRKRATKPGKATVSTPVLPDRRAMEGFMNKLLAPRPRQGNALAAAQSVMYDAWDATGRTKRIALARKALEISPLCADAFVLLAEEEASSIDEMLALYRQGVEAGAQALGPRGFKEYAGSFWGFHETRPYMRARAGLAAALWASGHHKEAIEHYGAMLGLNPNDNQGIRYVLASHLLERNDIGALKRLLKEYEDDGFAAWLYTQALLAFREKDPHADDLAEKAWQSNNHVPGILSGSQPTVNAEGGYITMGGKDEATEYVNENGHAWRSTPGAIEWLVKATRQLKPKVSRRDDAQA